MLVPGKRTSRKRNTKQKVREVLKRLLDFIRSNLQTKKESIFFFCFSEWIILSSA